MTNAKERTCTDVRRTALRRNATSRNAGSTRSARVVISEAIVHAVLQDETHEASC